MSRRHTEDSVIVSIDSVREMLKTETKPSDTQPAVRIAHPVAPEMVAGVPSIAEVRARRLARWNDDGLSGQTAVPLRPVIPHRRWQKAFWRLGLFILGGALAGSMSLVLTPLAPAPFSTAVDTVESAIGSSVLQARLSITRSDNEKTRTKAQKLSLTIDQLQSELDSLKKSESSRKEEAAKASSQISSKRQRISKRTRAAKRKRPKRRRRAKKKKKRRKLDSNDKRLDSLINGL